jgi:hypothetical protein
MTRGVRASRDWWGAKASPIAEPGRKSDRRTSLNSHHNMPIFGARYTVMSTNWLGMLQRKFLQMRFLCHAVQCKPKYRKHGV